MMFGRKNLAKCSRIIYIVKRLLGCIANPSIHFIKPNINDCSFVQRYQYYISRGVPDHSLAAQDQEIMERIVQKRIPDKLARNAELDPLITKLKQEVGGDYDFSVRKSIGEFKGD